MKKSIDQLIESLIHEKNMYDEILRLEKEKFQVIRNGNMQLLEKMTQKEQQYLMKMGTFEKIRRSVLVNVADELEVDEISSISEFLLYIEDDTVVEEIDKLRDELLKVIAEIKEVNQLNEKLMKQHLEYIQFNLEVLTGNIQEGNSYGGKASEKGKQKINLFDARI
ncbi:flagellar protein FlgN [Alkaliphilus pronyensis]|uniref:Flagellar protein FlgN n=1 Tax=Alkaliphilus pronyensis TaxID=1482732 RepID=A0A6I0FKR0_9FIRM|nr:flagellar protein FlgN [Alkaliphilus pronyensis]KAB3539677.1 flagellar protein FlgN [Alkaliphilus pronyensis]